MNKGVHSCKFSKKNRLEMVQSELFWSLFVNFFWNPEQLRFFRSSWQVCTGDSPPKFGLYQSKGVVMYRGKAYRQKTSQLLCTDTNYLLDGSTCPIAHMQ